jgi:hypothetical protein
MHAVWRALNNWRYSPYMEEPSRRKVEPGRRPEGIDRWAGLWVALKDGNVIAAADNTRDLVARVRGMGPAGDGAVAQYVPPRTDDIVIGVG